MNLNLTVTSYSYFLWQGPGEINEAAQLSLTCSGGWTVVFHVWRFPPATPLAPIIQRPSKTAAAHIDLSQLPRYLDLLNSGPVTATLSDSGAVVISLHSKVFSLPAP